MPGRDIEQPHRDAGRATNRRIAGTGNPRAPLEERSKDELYNLAEQTGVKGRSRMNKTQLISAIRRRNGSDL
jgi:hypothetical protein